MSRILIGTAALMITLLAGCGGDEPFTPPPGGDTPPALPSPASAPALKTVIAGRFGMANYPVGAAIEPASTTNPDSALLIKHFSSITAENVMKPDTLWPSVPGTSQPASSPNFTQADILVNFAAINNIQLRGHTLLWHRTIPAWMLEGDRTNPANYRATLQQNLRNYILAVIQHFPNVYAWDVVNEVASDTQNSANPYRTDSLWYVAYSIGGLNGSDYIRDAFTFANQARTSIGKNSGNMKLMLNDYNTELPGKRANVIQIVQALVNAGVPIDGVGHQFHLQLNANVAEVTAALVAVEGVSSTLVNHVTELDVSIYADPGNLFFPAHHSALHGRLRSESAAVRAFPAGADLPCAVQRLQSSERDLGEPLGRRGQPHLAQHLSRGAYQSTAALRYRGPAEVGLLDRSRSDDHRALTKGAKPARISDNRGEQNHCGCGRWGKHEGHYCGAGRADSGRVCRRCGRSHYPGHARARRGASRRDRRGAVCADCGRRTRPAHVPRRGARREGPRPAAADH